MARAVGEVLGTIPWEGSRATFPRNLSGDRLTSVTMLIPPTPVKVAVANDYELVVAGLARLLSRFDQQVSVVQQVLLGDAIVAGPIDVLLYDTYGRTGVIDQAIDLLADPLINRLAVFSLQMSDQLIADGLEAGASGFISKALTGAEIADAIVRVAAGEPVMELSPTRGTDAEGDEDLHSELAWPGREDGLTQRESEVLVLVAEGLTNSEVGSALYLNVETVKSHVGKLLSKLELRNRVQLASYAMRSGAFDRYVPAEVVLDHDGSQPAPSR